MAEVIWSDTALEDLNDIGNYIAKDSVRYAEITIDLLFSRPDALEDYPTMGRIVPESNNEAIRELIEGNYRIIYRIVSSEIILILTIFHSKKDLDITQL